MEKIRISISNKTLNASESTQFNSVEVDTRQLVEMLKNNNYSLIKWKNGRRLGDNFESASGIVIDIDDGLIITDAIDKLKKAGLNFALITSKSHQISKNGKAAADRYHILIFFEKEIIDSSMYRRAFSYLKKMLPELDESCRDLARFIFASPDSAEYYSRFDSKNLDTETLPDDDYLSMPIGEEKKLFEFDNQIEVKLRGGRTVKLDEIKDKQPCHCFRPEHEDENASAFVVFNKDSDKWMMHCTGCGYTGWSEYTNDEYEMNQKVKNFYYLGKDIYELGMADEKFFMTKNDQDNFCYTIGAFSKDSQEDAKINLILNKRLRTLTRIDHIGNPYINESSFVVDKSNGLISVNIAAIGVDIKDNQFIEDYLTNTFGTYKDFIKEYLAMYVYTNYIKLPTLILYGPRGSSKTTFSGLVADIYPSLYIDWSGEASNFSEECENKLLIIEENLIDEKSQYKTLKKYTGQEKLKVHKKYQPAYMVKNNVNIILISNEMIPLYVEKTEKPTNDTNNQFFVWEFSPLGTSNDGTFRNKLRERLGNYIRTELKTVFDGINKNYTRYGIPVPITSFEEQLFENNTTNIESEADSVIEKIKNRADVFAPDEDAYELYRKGYLPYSLVEYYAKTVHPNAIIKNLKKRKIIKNDKIRQVVNKKKFTCYELK